ncbi:hypothetical protein D915_008513 [Fasciola hepatica]|uniref:CWF19 protein 2 n=1 Tax=Fasciola hepatica TaxID=6192 RepID=A0A2H1BXN4_FASHE|nr:hypothetical protein D915_008513 [Fasciola hepatica]
MSKSLNELIREERFRSASDMKYEFTQMAAKSGPNVDDEYADAFIPKRSNAERDATRMKQDAVAAYKRRTFAESSCTTCLERVPKHLVISVGEKSFLSLPEHVSMVHGQCFITPYEHIGSLTRVDDCTLREIISFKRQLIQMFRQQLNRSSCVFMETATKPDSSRAHTQIECIPIPPDATESVSGYFRKALEEIGSEWDQNRRVIKLNRPGFGAYGAVPPKFPYFAVEFGLDGGGLARILDDGRDIPVYFGREVIADLLEKDTRFWRKPKLERFEQLRSKVVQFENWWEPFDEWSKRDPRSSVTGDSSGALKLSSPEGPELPPGLH